MNARLMWELVDKPKWFFRLVLLVILALSMSQGTTMRYVLLTLVGLLALLGPAGDAYWILGLSRRDYNIQRRLEIGISVAIFVVIMVAMGIPWLLIAGYLFVAAIVLTFNIEIPQRGKSRKKELLSQSSGRTNEGRFPPTIEGQLIDRPQVKGWILIVCLTVATSLIYWGITVIWGGAWAQTISILAIIWTAMFFVVYQDILSSSLREYVTFGGTRTFWAKRTMLINAVVPGLLIAAGAVVPRWHLISALGAIYLLLVLMVIALGLTARTSWPVTVPVLIGAIALEVYIVTGINHESYILPTIAAVAGYVVGGVLLPSMARRTDIYSGGLARWLGMASTTS
ncbi:ABC transporter permease [Corynebacterium sp.]|uniref:ABC transporter permease n=1 Tax=Corynebacterium sp. TaxID=1720 RepID=UPI00264A00AB|nr:ABC transporter permease [Corynebacterium sp.]MDN6137654.1 ABC transporter permease [Corynebacterium sp.]MDN6738154.1 ABC transporter permease [Corynebacterium sp.]